MKRLLQMAVAVGLMGLMSACATAPATAAGKRDIETEAGQTRAKAERNDATLAAMLRSAYGYAVFPTVGKGGFGFGGAYGKGVLYRGGTAIGYCDMTQVTVGFQLGGQAYSEIIVFENKVPFDSFKAGSFAFDAQATAVAIKSGAAANAKYRDGVAVFTMDQGGLMFEASIGGQKFSFQAK